MTVPVTLLSPDEVRQQVVNEWADFEYRARSRPVVQLWDKNWTQAIPIVGETQARFIEKLNDTGEGNLVLFGDNKERDWIVDELGEWEDLHIRVIYGPYFAPTGELLGVKEWTGKADKIVDESDDEGFEHITIKFDHEFEHIKKIVCYANPIFPAEFQYPKIWALASGTVFSVSTLIFLNLLRRFALPWTFSDNIFDPGSWLANFNPANWPIVVVPKPFLFDTSAWCVLATRFGNCYDVIAPTLHDSGVQVHVYRWFPGMPQPASSHYTLTKPTLVVDVIDKSGYKGPSGTVLDGLLTFVTTVADDLINEIATEIAPTDPPQYSIAGFLGTTRDNPWVCWRNAMRAGGISGITSWKMTRHKAKAGAIVMGGHSPDWINTGIKLLLNAGLGYLGALIGNPALGLGLFEDQVENVVLAFHRAPNPARMQKMGINGPPLGEYWESTGSKGFSLSAIQAIRTGFYRTRAYTTFEVTCRGGAPYWPGLHFDVGDRVSAEIGKSGKLYVDYVYQLALQWGRDEDPTYEVLMGDGAVADSPGAMLSRQVAGIKDILQSLSVSS